MNKAIFCGLALAGVYVVFLAGSARGQTGGAPTLEARVKALETTVASLNLRVRALESSGPSAVAPTGGIAAPRGWEKLRIGMMEAEVRNILGEPHSVRVLGYKTYWYYDAGAHVIFNTETKGVVDWMPR